MPTMVPRKPYKRHLMIIQTQLLLPSSSDHIDQAAKPKFPPAAAETAAMLKSHYSDLIRKAQRGKIDDQIQRHKELRRRRKESRRKVLRMKPTAAFDDNAKIFKEFAALCGCPTPSLPYRFQGSSSLENFGLHLKTYTYDDIEEALRLDDADRDIEE
ncbi:hypothetical protein COLO4_24603 [Corchorus olitorius]|uniref:Uncharacterized protein n=1 Tax=Corchorus olitorius TaxID=93759 RepID=A0A1R3I8S4_9ROSI|nr:hypothetical protein COLO4_24603 [Corchorus olitorius]